MPCLRIGTLCRSLGITVDRYTSSRHQNDTNANWMMVKVIGIGRAFKMDFEDVLVSADVRYQIIQRPINRYETGARRASANSCALALILPLRARIVVIASLILFRGRCLGFLMELTE